MASMKELNSLLHINPQFSSVAQSCLTLCDPTDCSTPGFPVHHQLPELTQTQTQGRKELDTTEAI